MYGDLYCKACQLALIFTWVLSIIFKPLQIYYVINAKKYLTSKTPMHLPRIPLTPAWSIRQCYVQAINYISLKPYTMNIFMVQLLQISMTFEIETTSSKTSRTAAWFAVSPISTPPAGTIHLSGELLLEIRRTYKKWSTLNTFLCNITFDKKIMCRELLLVIMHFFGERTVNLGWAMGNWQTEKYIHSIWSIWKVKHVSLKSLTPPLVKTHPGKAKGLLVLWLPSQLSRGACRSSHERKT